MQQVLAVAAWVVVGAGLLMIVAMLGGPTARRQLSVVRVRRSLRHIDEVVAQWERDGHGRRSPYEGV